MSQSSILYLPVLSLSGYKSAHLSIVSHLRNLGFSSLHFSKSLPSLWASHSHECIAVLCPLSSPTTFENLYFVFLRWHIGRGKKRYTRSIYLVSPEVPSVFLSIPVCPFPCNRCSQHFPKDVLRNSGYMGC